METSVRAPADATGSAARYYDWSWKRYQNRIIRLTLVLMIITALAVAAAFWLGLRVRDMESVQASDARTIQNLEQDVTTLQGRLGVQREKLQTQQATNQCLDRALQRLNEGIRKVMALDLSPNAYLARYKIPGCDKR